VSDRDAGDTSALEARLAHEQSLREAAESMASQTQAEIEDLSVTLFSQANEMVAEARRAAADVEARFVAANERVEDQSRKMEAEARKRARLEARVQVLEKRDEDKVRRLGMLEGRVARVERVRTLLGGQNLLPVDMKRSFSEGSGDTVVAVRA